MKKNKFIGTIPTNDFGNTRRKKMKQKSFKGKIIKNNEGITLIALVVTIVLNFSYLEMARMNKFEKI